MGQKCVVCHENVPVIFTSRYEDGELKTEGVCLTCALENNIGGVDQFLAKNGITAENADMLQKQINQVFEAMQDEDIQEEVLSQMFNGDIPEDLADAFNSMDVNIAFQGNNNDDDDADEDDDEEDSDKDNKKDGGIDWPVLFPRKRQDSASDSGNKKSIFNRGSNKKKKSKHKYLDQYATNLNDAAKAGKLDPLIGRKKELNRVTEILNRRVKNNPVLIGEPGVGKTAIVQGLANKIVEGNVPPKLQDMELYELDITSIVAGTQFRGQFENRMKGIVEEATESGNIVLVIDELHNIMGAGDADGAMNAANILKPALAKGDIRVLGSTTLEDYRRQVEKDSALDRRFQKIIVDPPTEDQAMDILIGLRPYYEEHHHVTYSDDVLRACVKLSERYITDRFLPDKAIDLMDEAGSKANLKDTDLILKAKLEKEISKLDKQIQALLSNLPDDDSSEEAHENYAKQAELKSKRAKKQDELDEVEARLKPTEITTENIAEIVSDWTGIPVTNISMSERDKLLSLEELLHKRIVGQNEAVSAVSRAIRRNRAGLKTKKKPVSFVFVGPTGVGKTELVKALAEVMFDDEDNMIRLDMSEFMEAHTVSKLIGSPPGYVGYDDGGQLTEKVRRKPYSVILFDEIEKAHNDIFNILLQILDEGRLTDAQGRTVDFSHTIIVMTSNVGTSKSTSYGFGNREDDSEKQRILDEMRDTFRPEFLNRIDEIVVFHRLKPEEIRKIVDLQLDEVNEALIEATYCNLRVSSDAKDYLAKLGYSEEYGARELQRTITKNVEDRLAEMKIKGELEGCSNVAVTLVDGELQFDAN